MYCMITEIHSTSPNVTCTSILIRYTDLEIRSQINKRLHFTNMHVKVWKNIFERHIYRKTFDLLKFFLPRLIAYLRKNDNEVHSFYRV